MDGIITYLISRELTNILSGNILRKIYEMSDGSYIFQFYGIVEQNLFVKLKGEDKRFHLIDGKKAAGKEPSSFCMLMRKYLQGRRLTGVENQGFEKRSIFNFSDKISQWQLIFEFHERDGNIILLSGNNKVLGSYRTMGDKRMSENKDYYAPSLPPHKCDPLSPQAAERLKTIFENGTGKLNDKIIKTFIGFSKETAEQLLAVQSGEVTDYPGLLEKWNDFFQKIESGKLAPTTYSQNGIMEKYSLWDIGGHGDGEAEKHSSVNDMLCSFYKNANREENFETRKKELRLRLKKELEKLLKKRTAIAGDLEKLEKNRQLKRKGELILTNLYMIRLKDTSIKVDDIYESPPSTVEIELDPSLSASDNAQKYFEKFKKSQRGIPILTQRLDECNSKIIIAKENLEKLEKATEEYQLLDASDLFNWQSKTAPKESHFTSGPRRYSYKNFDIIAGKNPEQNDEISLKISNKADLWFHTRGIPGSHVIIRTKSGEKMPNEVIVRAATIAAYFSKAKKSAKVPVSYTLAKNVAKKKGMPPGMVTISGETTLIVNPQEYDFLEWIKTFKD